MPNKTMTEIRAAAVSGSFYPSDPVQLQESVDLMIQQALLTQASTKKAPSANKAIIAPHAGHVYSGPIAASVYARLMPVRELINRVILLGPSHHVGFKGIAVSTMKSYETPLGLIELDQDCLNSVLELPNTGFLDDAHTREHSLEVHLPFLQRLLGEFSLVPLVVGEATKQEVSMVIEALWGGPETLIIVSSDLSHFHSYAEAQIIDQRTSGKIVNLESNLTGEEACGCRPINGLLHFAKKSHFRVQQIDVRNSGDTAGDANRVVGYGAYAIVE